MRSLRLYMLIMFSFILCMSFSSCISLKRNIVINKDGSGTETLDMHLDKSIFTSIISLVVALDSTKREEVTNSLYDDSLFTAKSSAKYRNIEGMSLMEMYSGTNPDSSKSMHIKYGFDNIQLLSKVMENSSSEMSSSPDSKVTVEYADMGDSVLFLYTIKQPEGYIETDSSKTAKQNLSALFAEHMLTFNVELPYDVVYSNAVTSNGRSLTWEFDMRDVYMLSRPVVLKAVMRKN